MKRTRFWVKGLNTKHEIFSHAVFWPKHYYENKKVRTKNIFLKLSASGETHVLTLVPFLNGIARTSDKDLDDCGRWCNITFLVVKRELAFANLVRLDNKEFTSGSQQYWLAFWKKNYHKTVSIDMPEHPTDADVIFSLELSENGLDGMKGCTMTI